MSKLCADCKWFDKWLCHNPKHKEKDPVSGGMVYRKTWMRRPDFVRAEGYFNALLSGTCGKSGRFWEPK